MVNMASSEENVDSTTAESKKENTVGKEDPAKTKEKDHVGGKAKVELKVNGEVLEKSESELLKEIGVSVEMKASVNDSKSEDGKPDEAQLTQDPSETQENEKPSDNNEVQDNTTGSSTSVVSKTKSDEKSLDEDKKTPRKTKSIDGNAPKEQRSRNTKGPSDVPSTLKAQIIPEETKEKMEKENPVSSSEPAPKEQEISKFAFRMETWTKLENADLTLLPKPCKYRIPRFKGELEAAQRLSELDIFKSANVVKVILDKAHECLRLQVIEAGKELIVGAPGLREAVFLHMHPPVDPNKNALRMASSRGGIDQFGSALKFEETKADLVIVGAVAVDKNGHRIGRGEGFSDLEFALLKKLGSIAEGAPIVTVVHDLQVYESLPETIFTSFDVPVDYIVTPTQVIEVKPTLPRPSLQWSLLSNRRVNNIPIIKQLLDREQVNGEKIELKEVDSDLEESRPQFAQARRFFRPPLGSQRRRFSSRSMGNGRNGRGRGATGGGGGMRGRRENSAPEGGWQGGNEGGGGEGSVGNNTGGRGSGGGNYFRDSSHPPFGGGRGLRNNWTRTFRRRSRGPLSGSQPSSKESQSGNGTNNIVEGGDNGNVKVGRGGSGGVAPSSPNQRKGRKMNRPKYPVAFTVRVNGLTSGIRVRDLKAALLERGVRPRDISWRGTKGIAFLHFSKTKPNNEVPVGADDIVASLQGLKIKYEGDKGTNIVDLSVEPSTPISRIEVTNVAQV